MPDTDWQRLYDSLEIVIRPGESPVAKPTKAMLDAFERDTGFQLPLSYREFISTFGPGEIGGRFSIKAPGYAKSAQCADLLSFTDEWRSILPENYPDPRVGRLFYFCETIHSDFIGWDPTDVRDARTHEYGIYICVHERETCDLLAASFDESINSVCLSDGLPRFLGINPSDCEPPKLTFAPWASE